MIVHRVLIETLWNVKSALNQALTKAGYVLIETLWNVKFRTPYLAFRPDRVLIETLWNVKEITLGAGLDLVGF